MKRGVGIAIALGLVSMAGSFFIFFRMESDAKTVITPQKAEQFFAANEIIMISLNEAVNAFATENGDKIPEKAEELIPSYLEIFPKEMFSQLTHTVQVYDGLGGWVYEGGAFRPNHPQKPNVQ